MSAGLHTEESGPDAAPLVVLHHGFAGSARNWRPQMRALRERAHVVAFDARGHARTATRLRAARFGLDDFVRDFSDVAAAHGGTADHPFVAGGLSLGAAVALHFALREPERVRGLVLAAPPGGRGHGLARHARAFAEQLEREGPEAAGARFVWGPGAGLDAQAGRLVRQGFLEHPPQALAAILRQTIAALPDTAGLAPALARLEVPVLIVVGARDRGSLEPARALARALPRARRVEIEGAGHVVNLDAREAFDRALQGFLEELGAAPAPQPAHRAAARPGQRAAASRPASASSRMRPKGWIPES